MAKIGIDARLTHYRPGGISTYVRQFADALGALSYQHKVILFESRKAKRSIANVLPSKRLWTPPHHRFEKTALSLELQRHELDVFHSTDFIPPRGGAKKHVITVHDLTFLHFPQHKDKAAQRYYNDQIAWAVNKADHILSVSAATKHDLTTMLNVPPEKITVQPHGVDPNYKPLSRQSIHQLSNEIGIDVPESGYILFVGTLEPRKNIDGLLDAYQLLKERRADIPPLILVGQIGWLFDDTLESIKALQSAGLPITLRYDVTDAALPIFYNQAAVLVLPSHYEGFGLPLLEAMACGTPVVASNNSAMPEVVGDAGLLFDTDNTEQLTEGLEQSLFDSAWRERAIDAGIKRAGQFTWRRSAEIALTVYEKVLA